LVFDFLKYGHFICALPPHDNETITIITLRQISPESLAKFVQPYRQHVIQTLTSVGKSEDSCRFGPKAKFLVASLMVSTMADPSNIFSDRNLEASTTLSLKR